MKKLAERDIEKFDELKSNAWSALDELRQMLIERSEYAEDWFGDRSEAWQESERGNAHEEWAGDIAVRAEEIEEILDTIDDIDFESITAPEEV